MNKTLNSEVSNKKYVGWIWVLSIAIPIVVAVLMLMPKIDIQSGFDIKILPHVNAILNTATSVCLILGFLFIKSKNEKAHRIMMVSAFALSLLFLLSYVLYHATAASTPYGGEGWLRSLYFFILITHILLAIVVVPLVLFALYLAFTRQITKHKRLVKWAYPIWLYVAVTGVTVYLMISPYY